MHQYVLYPTREDIAQVVQCRGRDVATMLQRVQRPTAERVVLDERIGRDSLAAHGVPERFVRDNKNHLFRGFYYIVSLRP